MKRTKVASFFITVLFALVFVTGCSLPSNPVSSPASTPNVVAGLPNGGTLHAISGPNVINLTVNGSECAANSYPNKPCVSVTICSPGTSNCQTIHDILLDTGSYGLRVFKSLITVPLTQVTSGSKNLAECVQFGDGTSDWGPVKKAAIVLGGESPVTVPIQVIDSTFVGQVANCSGADASPAIAGFNGILGVGVFAADCGADCTTLPNNQNYFACDGSSCTGSTVSLANQVQNPVASLSTDNNGVILELPSIPLTGQDAVNGYLVLGIGTQTNNQPSGVNYYNASATTGEFSTSFNGGTYASFIDSGSNGLFFPSISSMPACSGNFNGWYCPSSFVSLSAENIPTGGSSTTSTVPFQVGSLMDLGSTGNNVFLDIGGDGGTKFDWGLPFYIGRNVYLGIEGTTADFGAGNGGHATGPYWAY